MTACKAHNRQGGPCRQPAVPGAVVCRYHGGRSPQVLAAAKARLQQAALEEASVTFGLPVDVSPEEALLAEVRRTAGHVAWLGARVAELDAEALSWGRSEEVRKGSGEFPGTDTTSAARPPVVVELYQRERKHLVAVCEAAIRAGVSERLVRLAEGQGRLVVEVIRRVLDRLDLTDGQRVLVGSVVPEELRAVAALEAGEMAR